MSDDRQASMVGGLWFFSAIVLVALFISAAVQRELTSGHILLALVILGLVVVSTPILMRWQGADSNTEKAKREQIDGILHSLSDDELIALKRRLSDIDVNETPLTEYLGDDGELVHRH